MVDSITIVAFLALFAGVGVVFLFVNLAVGWLVRPNNPHEEKKEIYECGEPTIGSSFVQFDLRFYVVARLFIIFDVEVAFFFPWATVFGKANHLANAPDPVVAVAADTKEAALTDTGKGLLLEMGVANPAAPVITDAASPSAAATAGDAALRESASTLATLSIFDIGVFFAVLMVGFAYVWKRGDLDWVRAITQDRAGQVERATSPDAVVEEPVLTA